MNPNLDKTDLGQNAKHLAILVNGDSADRHHMHGVLVYCKDW